MDAPWRAQAEISVLAHSFASLTSSACDADIGFWWSPFLYLLIAPCRQHLLLLVGLHLAFFLFLLLSCVLDKSAQPGSTCTFNYYFKATAAVAVLVASVYSIAGIWCLLLLWFPPQGTGSPSQPACLGVQALAWAAFAGTLVHEKKFGILLHPLPLRLWWAANFLLSASTAAAVLLRLYLAVEQSNGSPAHLSLDDGFALATFPAAAFLFVVSLRGVTGITTASVTAGLTAPLLNANLVNGERKERSGGVHESAYAQASLFSRILWLWVNPLLKVGSKGTLQLDDVPLLAPQDRTEYLYSLLQAHFPAQLTRNTVTGTIFKCFWGWFLLNGMIMLVRISVMFVGPILITAFVDFASGSGQSAYRGYSLVITLLAAKCTEVLSSHHYNFLSQRLGMRVRSCMITTVYRKGLRLSTAGRQAHGIGPIVNYMTVDVQQLSDSIVQLHNVWAIPLQVLVAVIILFQVVGVSMFAGVASMMAFVGIAVVGSKWQRYYHSHIMKHRDTRMKATTEVLSSMKVIKLQSWEEHFRKRVEDLRLTEYGWLMKFVVTMGANVFSMWISSTVVALVTFTCAALIGFELSPTIIFTAITTFRILQEPVRALPQVLTAVSQALVSLDRLDKFMQSEELDTQAVTKLAVGAELAISVDGSSFTWDATAESPTLSNINVHIQPGSLVAIVGMVGSGKSSLLSSFLGEMPKLAGKVTISGTTAYVPQTAWIQNGTIEENIRFGGPMDKAKYQEAIRVCSLERDLELLEFGDQTEIGERGINLSGGQKQRIQLARAVYQDCDLYLLDDIFSAVDAHTGSHLFKKCILGALVAKTRVVVTHQVEFLHCADQILVMRNGTIVQSGKYNDLLQVGTNFDILVQAHKDAMDSLDGHKVATGGCESKVEGLEKVKSGGIELLDGTASPPGGSPRASQSDSFPPFQQQSSRTNSTGVKGLAPAEKTDLKKGTAKLIDEERRQVGHVGWSVYRLYVTKAYGWPAVVAVVLIQCVWQILLVCCDYWLAYETSPEQEAQFRPKTFVVGYLYLAIGICICVLLRTILVVAMGSKTAQGFFLGMLRCVLRAPMSFFDTTPTGRILSRASSDQTTLDILLPFFLSGAMAAYSGAFATLIVICQVTWQTVFVIVPLTYVYFAYQSYFIVTSRELTRIDAISKAPVIHHFSESVAGVAVIRSFQKQEEFSQVNVERVDSNIRLDFHNNAANEWLGYRLEMIGTIILCTSALLFVVLPTGYIDSDLVGLSLSYGLALNTSLYWSVAVACWVENRMVSVERLRQFSVTPSEAPLVIQGAEPPSDWPHQGEISIQDLQLRYRPNTPLVLKGISVSIKGGHKVGVVGRTGSGKSTLLQAIFRLIEPAGGRIIIDGVDISGLGLTDLRSRMSIIPQEPTLFEGSIRMNLDPLGEFKDEQIWEVLRKCQLESAVLEQPCKLDSQVVAGGDNWSVGQKQLLCLGRVLLKRSRILFLDEATASVDSHTDAVIQKIVKEDFNQCTQVSIAHRITTVMDSDNVLVIDAGKVAEYESPSTLLQQPNSLFGALVREYSTRSGKMS